MVVSKAPLANGPARLGGGSRVAVSTVTTIGVTRNQPLIRLRHCPTRYISVIIRIRHVCALGGALRHVSLLTNVKGLFGHSPPMCVTRIHCWAAMVWMGADRLHVVFLALLPHDVLELGWISSMSGGRSHSLEPILLGRHTPNWRGRSPCPSVERGGTSIGGAPDSPRPAEKKAHKVERGHRWWASFRFSLATR